MSLDVDGFTNDIEGGEVVIKISSHHRLLKLARNPPWDEMLDVILPDLKRTEKKCRWMGRPIRVRIHYFVLHSKPTGLLLRHCLFTAVTQKRTTTIPL